MGLRSAIRTAKRVCKGGVFANPRSIGDYGLKRVSNAIPDARGD